RRDLFMMLASEPFIIIGMAVLIAVLLGFPLQEFFISNRMNIIRYEDISISRLWLYSIEIGALLLVIVSLIIWFTLNRICKANDGLAANMRRSRNHIFRNVMLGFQLAVSLIFVCCTLILVNTGRNMLKNCNIPEKDDLYAQCLFLNTRFMNTHSIDDEERIERVCTEIRDLPEVDRVEMYCSDNGFDILELKNNPEAMAKMDNQSRFRSISTTDKDLPSFFGMEVEWFSGNVDRNECLLIGEDLYRRLKDAGVLNGNTLSTYCGGPRNMITLPVGGIIKNIPYTTELDQIVAITPYWKENYMNMTHVVIPKKGRGKGLDKKIAQLLLTITPENISNESMISNYRDMINWIPGAVKAVYVACLVLGAVSLLICAMGIFSAIALDTRGRRKEVAIRKVNGAKDRDIYKMFGQLYIVLIVVALIIAIPVCVFFSRYLSELEIGSISSSISTYFPIIFGSTIVTVLIFLIVSWQIRELLRTDTSTIISKE
ncbi:MAG: ABC transporter permease, partial [Muribaculaceae bacterium]|nr:ABC transporter permease [Muribaculaceae bacterium]